LDAHWDHEPFLQKLLIHNETIFRFMGRCSAFQREHAQAWAAMRESANLQSFFMRHSHEITSARPRASGIGHPGHPGHHVNVTPSLTDKSFRQTFATKVRALFTQHVQQVILRLPVEMGRSTVAL